MQIRNFSQPKEENLGALLKLRLEEKFSDVWIVSGFAKDTGFEFLLESLKIALESNSNVNIVIGIDKKNTSKDMLIKLLGMGSKLTVHINTEEDKFETRAYIFKGYEKSYVYLTGGKFSEGGLTSNNCIITEIIYEKDEVDELSKFINNLKSSVIGDNFKEVTEKDVISLAENGEIVARIIDRKIPSISEMYKKDTVEIGIGQYDESVINNKSIINKDEIEDIDFDVMLPVAGEIKIKKSLGEEVEQQLKSSKVKIKTEEKESMEKRKAKIITNGAEPDFKDMKGFVMQINKVTLSGVGMGEIKIPHSVSENMHKFLDYPLNFHMREDEKGKLKETSIVQFTILDTASNFSVVDKNVCIYENAKYLAIKSSELNKLNPNENDIIRLVKEDESRYKCELIRINTKEYDVWERFCTYGFKGYSRRYGIV